MDVEDAEQTDIPSADELESRLEALDVLIPNFELVDRVDGLVASGHWTAALGAINHPGTGDAEASPAVMVFAVLVVIDLSSNHVRLANPLHAHSFTAAEISESLAAAMVDPLRGVQARPEHLICPQPGLARVIRPFMLKVDVPVEVTPLTGFGEIFTRIRREIFGI